MTGPAPAEPVADATGDPTAAVLSDIALQSVVESLLFVAPSPVAVARLAQVTGATEDAVEGALAALSVAYAAAGRGLRLLRRAERVHLTTAPEAAAYIERFLGLDLSSRLSTAALETLAVIAYRQPLTRGDIETIRGVSCDGVLRTLIARELVEPVGRLEQPGRPFLYGTTLQFLHYFGLESLDRLPPLHPDQAQVFHRVFHEWDEFAPGDTVPTCEALSTCEAPAGCLARHRHRTSLSRK